MRRKCKYSTEERKAAQNEASRRWFAKNRSKAKKAQEKWRKANQEKINESQRKRYRQKTEPNSAIAAFEARLASLEGEVRDILADLDECFKENKRLADLAKWGKK